MILLLFTSAETTSVVIVGALPAMTGVMVIQITPLEWLVATGGGWAVADSGRWPLEIGAGWAATPSRLWPAATDDPWEVR